VGQIQDVGGHTACTAVRRHADPGNGGFLFSGQKLNQKKVFQHTSGWPSSWIATLSLASGSRTTSRSPGAQSLGRTWRILLARYTKIVAGIRLESLFNFDNTVFSDNPDIKHCLFKKMNKVPEYQSCNP
jgi:hypothetical protein